MGADRLPEGEGMKELDDLEDIAQQLSRRANNPDLARIKNGKAAMEACHRWQQQPAIRMSIHQPSLPKLKFMGDE